MLHFHTLQGSGRLLEPAILQTCRKAHTSHWLSPFPPPFPLLLLWAGRRRYGAKFCSHHTLSYGSHSAIGFVILVPLVGTMLQFSPTFCNFLVHISNVIRDSAMPRWHTNGTSTGYAWACLMHMETMQHVLQTGTWSQAKDSWQCNSSLTGLSNLQQKADLVFVQIPS